MLLRLWLIVMVGTVILTLLFFTTRHTIPKIGPEPVHEVFNDEWPLLNKTDKEPIRYVTSQPIKTETVAPEPPPPLPTAPPMPPKKEATNICTQHGGWRVDVGRSWHCEYPHKK
jgi:hypothetical protein